MTFSLFLSIFLSLVLATKLPLFVLIHTFSSLAPEWKVRMEKVMNPLKGTMMWTFFHRASNETSRIKSHWVEHHLFSQPGLFKNLFPTELKLSLRRTKFPSSVSSPRHSSIIAISHSYSPCLCLWWTKYAKSFQIKTHGDKFCKSLM